MNGQTGQRGSLEAGFKTTQWSVVLAAGEETVSAASREALTVLCATYWSPLYAYVRHRGYRVEEAEDLTQAFFAMLLEETGTFRRANPGRGKFRKYLLATLRYFLNDASDKARAVKRGGKLKVVPLDVEVAESRVGVGGTASSQTRPAEWYFDREWALTVLRITLTELEAEYTKSDRLTLFQRLRPILTGETARADHKVVAAELGMSVDATKAALSRLRERYGDGIRREIARTLGSAAEVEEEVRHLFDVLRS